MDKTFQELLNRYSSNTVDPYSNLELGQYYDNLGQSASALSFYLRAAELTEDPNLAYDCLVRNALLIEKLQRRPHSTKGQLLHAIAQSPTRPEAYYHLSRVHEQKQEWQELYTAILQAQTFKQPYTRTSTLNLDYPGDYVLDFQKAVAAWWLSREEESTTTFRYLLDEHEMRWDFALGCINNLGRLGQNVQVPLRYTPELEPKLRMYFKGLEELTKNYSDAYQDFFVLTMLDGKEEGTYLEIGSADPFYNNNTALLETKYKWKGTGIDYLKQEVEKYQAARKNKCIHADAREVDYTALLKPYGQDIDYLQLDCDPPSVTYEVLERIPFNKHRFAVITYEHDSYREDGATYRTKSREYLSKQGYVLVAGNIAPDKNRAFEDWWIHPELVSKERVEKMTSVTDTTKRADLYMQGEYK
jgi:tetratricopeptide (TPR) repeat protein